MLEIEIKAYCNNLNERIEKIISLGGLLLRKVHEEDTYYKHPARDFAKTDEAFRIRIEDDKNILTYKGPKTGIKSKTRLEEEVEFSDAESMKSILGRLGFEPVQTISKTREIYKINDIEVCCDNVDGLGNFIELETKGEDQEAGEKKLFDLADALGLSKFERRSYLELMLEKERKRQR